MALPPPLPLTLTHQELPPEIKARVEQMEARTRAREKAEALKKSQEADRERVMTFLDAVLRSWLVSHPQEPLTQALVTQLVHQAFLAVEAAKKHDRLGLDEAGTEVRARFRAAQLDHQLGEATVLSEHKERF